MKIAFPVQENQGMESPVHSHFGSAQFFVVVDTDSQEAEVLANQDLDHKHGSCQPLAALGTQVDAVVAGGIGGGALAKLRAAGVKVFRGMEGSVRENLEMITAGRLPEFAPEHTCGGHGSDGPCAH